MMKERKFRVMELQGTSDPAIELALVQHEDGECLELQVRPGTLKIGGTVRMGWEEQPESRLIQ